MEDTPEESVTACFGCNIGITFLEGDPEPVVILSFQPNDGGEDINIAMRSEDLEKMFPAFLGAVTRSRVVAEMVTLYPEQREEILANIMFRWTGTILEEDGDGSPA